MKTACNLTICNSQVTGLKSGQENEQLTILPQPNCQPQGVSGLQLKERVHSEMITKQVGAELDQAQLPTGTWLGFD